MNKTVFLFATHKLTDFVLEQYYRLKLATKNIGVLYLLIEDGELQQIPVDVKYYSFSVDTLNELNYEPIEESIIPGSNHFPVLQFYKEHPEFLYYWNIEYDVYFNGKWESFFDPFEMIISYFISSHIEWYTQRPKWDWWKSVQFKTLSIPQNRYLKSFNPIYRISNRALKALDGVLSLRNSGHHEVVIPTVLDYLGYTINDFGGNSEFTLCELNIPCYLSNSELNNWYTESTMRYRPVFNKEAITRKGIDNMLYHPIKF